MTIQPRLVGFRLCCWLFIQVNAGEAASVITENVTSHFRFRAYNEVDPQGASERFSPETMRLTARRDPAPPSGFAPPVSRQFLGVRSSGAGTVGRLCSNSEQFQHQRWESPVLGALRSGADSDLGAMPISQARRLRPSPYLISPKCRRAGMGRSLVLGWRPTMPPSQKRILSACT